MRVVATLLAAVLCSCSTTGQVDRSLQTTNAPKTIYVPEYRTGHEAQFIDQVVRTFEKYGYEAVPDRKAATYYLDFSIKGGAVIDVHIELLRDGKQVLSVASSNAGFGTIVARPVARSGRVAEAVEKLDEVLSGMQ
jgi:hypothetical protein